MHSYDNVASVERKKKNWALLGRFFKQHTAAESISAGFSTGGIASNVMGNVLGNLNGGAGMPKDNDETSHTNSVISPATVTITGTGDATTDHKSQANADTLTERDASTANATLANTLTLQQAQELQAQQQKAQDNQRAADLAGAALNGMVRAKAVSSNGAAALGRESDGGDASLPAESDLDVMERQHQADLQRVDAIRAQLGRQLRV
ncbi:MAG: hypothetical protein WDW36_008469 [Sanguina aurantia]